MKILETTSDISALSQVKNFVSDQLQPSGCAKGVLSQIKMAVEEIFVNISNYAYDGVSGPVTVKVDISEPENLAVISFSDSGVPFGPLEKAEPDLNTPVKERQKGGLGIFMVRKLMDDVAYEYTDGHNVLTVSKRIF